MSRSTFDAAPRLTALRPMTYADTVRRGARNTPEATALICGGEHRSWREVRDRSAQAAQAMLAAGVQPQDRVAFVGRNCLEFFEILYGASMVRAVPAGINWRLAPADMLSVIDDTQAPILFIEREFLDQLRAADARPQHARTVVVIDRAGALGSRAHGTYEHWLAGHPPHDPELAASWDDIAMQTYTSGTTGVPKGVMHSVEAIAASFAIADILEISDRSVVLVATPVFHATATAAVAMVLNAGGQCVIARDAEPETLLRLIERHGVTLSILVPTILRMLIDAPSFGAHDVSSIRTLGYTAAPISEELLIRARQQLSHVRFLQVYGSSETLGATVLRPEEHADHLASAGRPLPGVTIRLVDALTGDDAPAGTTGEIWVKAPTAMAGYWNRPDETASAITPGGFVRTGDLGRFDGEFLVLRDRLNDMIISGAENIYPAEVENVLARHPLIDDVAVIGVPSDKWGETVLAFVVPRRGSGCELTEQDVIAFARANLATYKCPREVRFLDALPRNASGKVLKTTLREPFWPSGHRRIG